MHSTLPDKTTERFLAAVLAQVGVPFAVQGRTPFRALDCVGVVVCSAEIAGLRPTYTSNYSLQSDYAPVLESLAAKNCSRVPLDEMRPGDVLLFWLTKKQRARHIGVLVDGDGTGSDFNFVHTSVGAGSVVQNNLTPEWQRRIHSVWRFEDLT